MESDVIDEAIKYIRENFSIDFTGIFYFWEDWIFGRITNVYLEYVKSVGYGNR